jgi:predicted deacylase
MTGRLLAAKIVIIGLGVALLATSGASFYSSRRLREPVVLGPGVTSVKQLADSFEPLRGTANNCNIYILEGQQPGATMLVLGGSHAEEPAGRLVSWILAENAVVQSGRLIVVLSANRSASTMTRLGGAYPPDFSIKTDWGSRTFRMGDRWTNPLDQWPDPEVYFHYPSGQQLAYVDIRNVNRTWPGRANGTLTEQTSYAFMELIKREKVDVAVDLHEAELQYPVISTIVTHQRGQDMASMVSMMLTDMEGFKIGTEFSPRTLHGLSHREIGDHSPAVSLLFGAPEPFLDATRGVTSPEQPTNG